MAESETKVEESVTTVSLVLEKNGEVDALEQQALDEILKETKRSAERAKEMGALGWKKGKIPSTNKTFLKNMLVSTLRNIDSPKHSQYRSRGRENHREYYDTRKHRRDYREDDRAYKDSFYTGKHINRPRFRDKDHYHHDREHSRDREHSHDRAERNSKSRHRKERKSRKDSKSTDRHKSKHSKSKKSKKKSKNKRKESKEES